MSRQPLTDLLLRHLRRALGVDTLAGSFDTNMGTIRAALADLQAAQKALARALGDTAVDFRANLDGLSDTLRADLDGHAAALASARADLVRLRDEAAVHGHGELEKQVAQILWRPPIPEHSHPVGPHDHALVAHEHAMPAHEHENLHGANAEHGHHWMYSSTDNMNGVRRNIYRCDDCGAVEVHAIKGG